MALLGTRRSCKSFLAAWRCWLILSGCRSRILLARSPTHIHSLAIEYLKTSRNSLTHAIKESFTGSVEKMFLYAVENGKRDRDGPGVCECGLGRGCVVD